MLSGRPFLYLTVPSVAFILGVFWYHRRSKRIVNDKNDDNDIITKSKQNNADINDICKQNILTNGNISTNKPSRSMSINNGNISHRKHGQPDIEDDNSSGIRQFGKSAPINIVPNRNSPSKTLVAELKQPQTTQIQANYVDSEILKTKIQDAEQKILRSIDEDFENLSSPVDLPDTVQNNRIGFYAATRHINIKRDEPVVIKATTTPKISPENSFLESKYVKSAEQNNNCDDLPITTNIVSATTRALSQSQQKSYSNNNKSNCKQESNALPVIQETKYDVQQIQQCVKQDSNTITEKDTNLTETATAAEVSATTIVETETETETPSVNTDEKRTLDAASPSLSLCSEQSGDSGKGSSLPRSEATRGKTTYEFLFPANLIGHLYGRKHAFLKRLNGKTGANITLSHENVSILGRDKVRICVIEGSESEINAALAMIRQRLPLNRFPNFNMNRIHFALPQTVVPLSNENLLNLQLNLIEGINNDVAVSAIISGCHIFVQQPLHPTHPSLALLQKGLYDSYTSAETPLLPNIEIGAVCVTCVNSVWYRVQIVTTDTEDAQRCLVRFLDFGGYMNVHFNDLRQIRTDFMSMPFQATECILSNILPIDECWTPEAVDTLCKLTNGIVLQAQVAGYNMHNVPEIYLFACLGPNNVIFINKELVARNLAQWVETIDA